MPFTPKPKFELSAEYAQLALGLDLPEVELDGISAENARVRSEAGRSALAVLKGQGNQPTWFERFEALITGGWPWRQACYIAWASMPKDGRMPETQEQLAKQYLNLTSDRAIMMWRKKNPAVDAMVQILQSAELWEHRADSFRNLIDGMQKAGDDYKFFNHLKLFMEMTGDYVPLNQVAAVLKRKADGGPQTVEENTLNELAEGAEELEAMIRPAPPLTPPQMDSSTVATSIASAQGNQDDLEEEDPAKQYEQLSPYELEKILLDDDEQLSPLHKKLIEEITHRKNK
jgi:hypothetical protein